MTAPAPLSEVLEHFDLEMLWLEDQQPEDKMCSFPGHTPKVKATTECVCLACGRFCGYACDKHERYLVSVLEKNIRGHKLVCRHCWTADQFTFVPIPE